MTEGEIDRLIECQHLYFPGRTLEQMALIYAQYAENARNAGQDGAAAWYDIVASALHQRLTRTSNIPLFQFSPGDRVEVLDKTGEVVGRGIITRIIASGMGFSIEFEDTVPDTNSRTGVVLARKCRKVGVC